MNKGMEKLMELIRAIQEIDPVLNNYNTEEKFNSSCRCKFRRFEPSLKNGKSLTGSSYLANDDIQLQVMNTISNEFGHRIHLFVHLSKDKALEYFHPSSKQLKGNEYNFNINKHIKALVYQQSPYFVSFMIKWKVGA